MKPLNFIHFYKQICVGLQFIETNKKSQKNNSEPTNANVGVLLMKRGL